MRMMSEDDEVTIEGINTLNVIPRLLTAGRYLFILVCVCACLSKIFRCPVVCLLCVAPNGKNSSTF